MLACPGCGVSDDTFRLSAMPGTVRLELFPWQRGMGGPASKPNGPRFNVEQHGTEHVDALAHCCGHRFATIAPVLIRDAKGEPEPAPAAPAPEPAPAAAPAPTKRARRK